MRFKFFKKKEKRLGDESEDESDGERITPIHDAQYVGHYSMHNNQTRDSNEDYRNHQPQQNLQQLPHPVRPRPRTPSQGLETPTSQDVSRRVPMADANEYPMENGDISRAINTADTPEYRDGVTELHTDRTQSRKSSLGSSHSEASGTSVFDDSPMVVKYYEAVPMLELTKLPRGGVSMETQAVGRVQFGIPPETIKDSMKLGLSVPAVYIVPVERFCREMGPALGVNLAEFEFPAYFNFFVYKKRCTLVVDSEDAEQNIRRVFSETLLGPAQFRREGNSIAYEEEDFAPEFDREAIPNFQKEFKHFRIMPDGKELVLETLLNFRHFEGPGESGVHENLGIPPPSDDTEIPNHISTSVEQTQGTDEKTAPGLSGTTSEETKWSLEEPQKPHPWNYSHARWIGDVATVWPVTATKEEIQQRSCKRVEIFKMPGGNEYVLHDIDENNHIVGKALFPGHVKVSESMSVHGFLGKSKFDDTVDSDDCDDDDDDDLIEEDDEDENSDSDKNVNTFLKNSVIPPTFHPPSFGVTVLGNSHGFDKSGSVSGYVLWINGRGVMIDPPPYSSATLEREGIRPRTIVGIILTHCHADHDAGAFQKVLTGSPVVVITTPTIYKSFIRKYAALSALSPALLRHSHRHKPAIIGRPLRFQGATFHFTYTLHTIPCVGFKVEWRGRSMVFTGDHLNSPPAIDQLQESGVLSKARADDLRMLPLQETDLLLHEAGAPPIHTPLDVLMALPERVKDRLFVVHTSALPEDSQLRVAPTGTNGTIRLDQPQKSNSTSERNVFPRNREARVAINLEDDGAYTSHWSSANEYEPITEDAAMEGNGSDPRLMASSFAHLGVGTPIQQRQSRVAPRNSLLGSDNAPPLVSLRPASSTDAWFILNLLSAVPFLTSLSYASTMEVLETARVDAYCKDDVIVPSCRRNQVLCVVWEGTCVEREKSTRGKVVTLLPTSGGGAVWHAGDWTGPIALQPDKRLSGESALSSTHDVVAVSQEGVKVITVEFSNLHAILKTGSALYRKYVERRNQQRKVTAGSVLELPNRPSSVQQLLEDAMRNLNVLELLDTNSTLRKLNAVQKRHLESLAEGPVSFQPGERLWRAGAPVDKAYIVVAGTAAFVPKRRNAGSVGLPSSSKLQHEPKIKTKTNDLSKIGELTISDSMLRASNTVIQEFGSADPLPLMEDTEEEAKEVATTGKLIQLDAIFARTTNQAGMSAHTDAQDYAKLSKGLQRRAKIVGAVVGGTSADQSLREAQDIGESFEEDDSASIFESGFLEADDSAVDSKNRRLNLRRRSSRARFVNKILGRLYSTHSFNGGLIFSRGHFLADVSKMVAGLLSADNEPDLNRDSSENDGSSPNYGFGENEGGGQGPSGLNQDSVSDMNQDNEDLIVHSTTLTAGRSGCVVLVFPKSSLIPFLDEYPGLLLSLLGTQVVV